MVNPIINILTRTSNRPKGFKRCYDSIQNQTYKNIRHLVSYDTDKDLLYLKDKNVDLFKINKQEISKEYKGLYPNNPKIILSHNLYINFLLKQVKEGWVLILDDDDYLYSNNSIEKLVDHIKKVNEDTILIFQMEYPDKRIIPGKKVFKGKKIQRNNIGSCCFMFNSKYKNDSIFTPKRCGDYDFIEVLYKKIKHNLWINEPFVKVGSRGGLGKRKDIN